MENHNLFIEQTIMKAVVVFSQKNSNSLHKKQPEEILFDDTQEDDEVLKPQRRKARIIVPHLESNVVDNAGKTGRHDEQDDGMSSSKLDVLSMEEQVTNDFIVEDDHMLQYQDQITPDNMYDVQHEIAQDFGADLQRLAAHNADAFNALVPLEKINVFSNFPAVHILVAGGVGAVTGWKAVSDSEKHVGYVKKLHALLQGYGMDPSTLSECGPDLEQLLVNQVASVNVDAMDRVVSGATTVKDFIPESKLATAEEESKERAKSTIRACVGLYSLRLLMQNSTILCVYGVQNSVKSSLLKAIWNLPTVVGRNKSTQHLEVYPNIGAKTFHVVDFPGKHLRLLTPLGSTEYDAEVAKIAGSCWQLG